MQIEMTTTVSGIQITGMSSLSLGLYPGENPLLWSFGTGWVEKGKDSSHLSSLARYNVSCLLLPPGDPKDQGKAS